MASKKKEERRKVGLYERETTAFTHPAYDAAFDAWEFYRQSLRGGEEYIRRHLFKHPKESDESYEERAKRAVYENHIRQIVETYAAQLFQRSVPRTTTNPTQATILEPVWNDITNTGVSADEYYEGVSQLVATYGVIAVGVDKYNGADEYDEAGNAVPIRSRVDELNRGVRPYAYTVEPHNLINWQVDTRGELVWAVVREVYTPPAEFDRPTPEPEFRYKVWTRQTFQLFTVEEVDDDEGEKTVVYRAESEPTEHGLGEVPIVFAFFGKQQGVDPIADPMIKDIAPLVRRAFNLRSLIDEEVYAHVFNILLLPESTYEVIERINFKVAGAIPIYPDEPEPRYLAPGTAQIDSIQSQIASTEGAIRLLSGLGRQNESNAAESGIALAFKNVDKKALYNRFAQILADLETKVNSLCLRWMHNGASDLTAAVPIPTYEVQLEPGAIETSLSNTAKFTSLPTITPTLAKKALQQAAVAYFKDDLTQEELQALIETVDAEFSVLTLPNGLTAFTEGATVPIPSQNAAGAQGVSAPPPAPPAPPAPANDSMGA